jgi:hypothetical protein
MALAAALSLLPAKPQVLLSDNGSEFESGFAKTLQAHGIKRWYTYPKTPKMNAHIERFNRTIQESFVDYHEELLFTDLARFNQKLADWLVFYNTQRPTIASASALLYHSSSNINPSAKGGGLIEALARLGMLCFRCHAPASGRKRHAPFPQTCRIAVPGRDRGRGGESG